MNRFISPRSALRPLVLLCTMALAAGAQAVVGPPAGGGVADYGNGGNVYEVVPSLFVQGLGNAGDPADVVALNPLLQYSASMSGMGSSLLRIDYQVRNTSPTESFDNLRFMFYANPDGGPDPFLDVVSEAWAAAAAGDPVRREAREFTFDPSDTIVSRFRLNNNLTEGGAAIDAGCALSSGCDATVGLQWDASTLGPGETFRVVVGLSDNGQSLSARWIDAAAVDSPDTILRLSGVSSIIPVPEPATWLLWTAGLAVAFGAAARRRQRC